MEELAQVYTETVLRAFYRLLTVRSGTAYQLFIDHLTTSKKTTETAFRTLYSTLSEAPDPYPLLEATIDSLLNFSDMQALTKDNATLKATVNRLSTQITYLESSAQAKTKELERKEKEKEEEAKRVEEVWRGVLDEKTRNWEGNERALTEKLEHQETVLKELKASYEVAQRMGPTSPDVQDDLMGKERSAEFEIVTRDLERTTLRLREVEGRNEQLRLELEKASSQDQAAEASRKTKAEEEQDESTILSLQGENASLLRKVNNAKADIETQKKEWERKAYQLERSVQSLEKDKEGLRAKVSKWVDYEDVKRELEILKSIEFSTGDDDEADDVVLDFSNTGTAEPSKPSEKKESLEQLLLARNKKLGNELTVLRVSHQDLTTRLQTLQITLDSTASELTSARALNSKLEDDLQKFQHETHHSSALSVAGTYVSRYPQSSIAKSRVSPTSSIIGGYAGQSPTSPFDSLRANESNSAGILPMITAQRDRFKQRNQQLEDELSRANVTVSALRGEIGTLKKDNLQLYEKTRYVSTYARGGNTVTAAAAATATAGGGSGSSSFTPASSANNNSIDRYRQAYEANISPFEAFRGRESARAYHRMGLAERLMYSFTRVILANRLSRNLFAVYCVLLHLLVFCMLYWTGTAEVERHIVGMAGEHLGGDVAAGGGVAAAGAAAADGGLAGPGVWHQENLDARLG
jgi:homeobox protein cut-like